MAALLDRVEGGDKAARVEEQLAAYREALIYFTRDRAPDAWVELQINMGVSLGERVRGSRSRNKEAALSTYRAALTVATRKNDPETWALAQNNFGATLHDRMAGSPEVNSENAIRALRLALEVRTKTAFPDDFATTSENLAIVLEDRKRGTERQNLDEAIAVLAEALAIRLRKGPHSKAIRDGRRLGLLHARRANLDGGPAGDVDRAIDLLSKSLAQPEVGLKARGRVDALVELGLASMTRFETSGDGQDVERAISAYERALAARGREEDPVAWAAVQDRLGDALMERLAGDYAENKERALSAYRDALSAVSVHRNRDLWAVYKGDLARAYDDRTRGDRADNLRLAVEAYRAALRHTSARKERRRWGGLQNNLCVAYSHLIPERASFAEKAIRACRKALQVRHGASRSTTLNNLATVYLHRLGGSRATNIQNAITYLEEALRLRTREVNPLGWAMMTDNLGTAYRERIHGDPATNMERAILLFREALTVRTLENAPRDWAATQNNLALTYKDRILGDRAQNVERAIESYEAALSIYSQASDPTTWAAIQDNLGNAWKDRRLGNAKENTEKAIVAYKHALTIRTREKAPTAWAGTMNNLSLAYTDLVSDSYLENLKNYEIAIAGFRAILDIHSRQATPYTWASTMNNLAVTLTQRPGGDNDADIEQAISYYEQALSVRTKTATPYDWANTTTNLAGLFRRRLTGDPSANLEKAIDLYHEAARIRTRASDPLGYLHIQKGLAYAYGKRLAGNPDDNQRARMNALRFAMETVDDLIDAGIDPVQTSIVMEAAGEVFRTAALQTARDGDLASALDLAERGRTRALRQALRLDTAADSLAPDKRQLLEEARASLEITRTALRSDAPGKPSDDSAARAIRQDVLRRRIDTAQAQITGLLPRRAEARLVPPDPPKDGAIVIPIVARDGAILLLVTAQGLSSVHLPDFDDARMRKMFFGVDEKAWGKGGWSRVLKAGEETGVDPATWQRALDELGREAWDHVVGLLVAELDALGVVPGSSLVFVLQDHLARMPIWLTPNPRSRKLLAETYRVTVSPDLARLALPPRTQTRRVAAWINGRSDPHLDLAGLAEGLVRASATVLDGTALTQASSLLQNLSGHTAWMLWTHGHFDRNDARASGLQLARSERTEHALLTVGDLLDARFGPSAPDLVVLLACESGLVDVAANDELVGLSTALLQAGARGVISALWTVEATATTLLAAKLSELLGQGERGSLALASAQDWLRNATAAELKMYVEDRYLDPSRNISSGKIYSRLLNDLETTSVEVPYASPYYWAAFVFAGSDQPGTMPLPDKAP